MHCRSITLAHLVVYYYVIVHAAALEHLQILSSKRI